VQQSMPAFFILLNKLLDWVRDAHQHHPKFAVMLTGSRTFEDLGPAWTDRFISALGIALE
jgi:hypothetical protein